ncbi:MAG TPA: hypothetical protein VMV16_08420 [Solirubrobacteraceae bacterium]|nr:hypothetical protein [Solirubrobacteraceae bacterium]
MWIERLDQLDVRRERLVDSDRARSLVVGFTADVDPQQRRGLL